MSSGPELTTVGSPLIDQVIATGWKLVTGTLDQFSVVGREMFRESLSKSDLRKTIECIDLRDGQRCLDQARISQAVSAPEVVEIRKRRVLYRGFVEKFLSCRVQVMAFLTERAT